ncbi:DUF1800 domain-containing protein [Mycolicibacterium vanbaalenii]|uniref:DUF1800 domain-containing protein n=1 Tax=Mycolicibacterium vanbaalenii TaxID=110539 RepID=UPI001F1E244A|nr:DUF1800 domain-containing protein [Mycolicibacterium vanbaalenii]UJL31839.1 DUF1800 domain-containing protein [Mycolicibacterium vanbaalenii]WND59659.1 DUF1800 domain-containing protein [Mycolicibacterium vanbaalenii]
MSTQSAEWIKTARVLRRSGFGARGSEIDSALNFGDTPSYVSKLLGADFPNDPGVVATPMPDLDVPDRPEGSDPSGRRRYARKVSELKSDLTHWWIRRMVAAENPANEKLTFLWHNHFATSMKKVGTAKSMANQNQKLRKLCLGDFRDLAYAMLTDAAMIKWLDGQQNKAGSPNENLSREFLELFALGHGNGYSEKDVREGARVLTGWTIRKGVEAVLVKKRHDDSTKTILGTTGKIGLEEFCDIVVSEQKSATFVAGRLWQQIASDAPPPAAALQRLVRAYGPDRDLRRLTTAILTDPDFLQDSATVVTNPVDWLIGVLRAVQAPMDDAGKIAAIMRTLESLGQLPFYPPDVGGWPRGQAWLSSSAVNIRSRAANEIVTDGDVSLVAEAAISDRLDAAGYLIGVGAWSERSAKALKPLRKNPTALVASAVITPEYLTA